MRVHNAIKALPIKKTTIIQFANSIVCNYKKEVKCNPRCKKCVTPKNAVVKKEMWIQSGSQEIAVMVG